ncbi:serpin family protein [Alkalicoccobacillus porphyridii]|uniref:Serpin domain-containing protein n=1 Tax=Alkalicoccobacillus porphyridii TaxID=2597270 RepID=A0A553ZTW2_9BACI|nr:serpin family protein [Alkalicoccobacillus porphyridii]TSB44785.1 hypothetical protein FN960_19470 [Alkalicoccobacillus porphyridii]
MKRVQYLLIGAGLILAGCGTENTEPEPRAAITLDHTFKNGQSQFAMNLFHEVFSEYGIEDNTHISPYSVQLALLLTANGLADADQQVILETLQLNELELDMINEELQTLVEAFSDLSHTEIETANAIWHIPELEVEESYHSMLKNSLVGEVNELPEEKPEDAINNWVEENTNGHIEVLLAEVPPEIVAYVINAVYFDANWLVPFEEEQTSPSPFHLLDGSTIEHPMMRQSADFQYYEEDHFQAIKIPYEDEGLTMSVILPEEGMFEEVVGDIDSELFWNGEWQTEHVDVTMPTFTYEAEYSLIPTLSVLGMDSVLLTEIDFAPLFGPDSLYKIDEILHKTFIKVDEVGTEAAAVTSVAIEETSAVVGKPFNVDRPFVFAITDEVSETILFMGSVVEPVVEEDE